MKDEDLLRDVREERRGRARDAKDARHIGARREPIMQGAQGFRDGRIAHMPDRRDPRYLGYRPSQEVGVRTVAVEKIVAPTAHHGREFNYGGSPAHEVTGEARTAQSERGLEVASHHGASPWLD